MGPASLQTNLCWWIVLSALIVIVRLRQQAAGCGLVVAYVMSLWAIHGLGAVLYSLPWWGTMDAGGLVQEGFQQATHGLFGAAIGAVLLGPFLKNVFNFPRALTETQTPAPGLARSYLAIGLFAQLILMPLVGRLATISALVAAGWRLLVVGLALTLWRAWHERHWKLFAAGLVVSLVGLPLLTITQSGFLSYGSASALTLVVFVATFARPRWRMVAAMAVLGYVGLSFYVTYMQGREGIRAVVWDEAETSLTERAGPILETLSRWEWLDLHNETHLWRIDERLNQNFLVGASGQYLEAGMADFAQGATVRDAFLALVPRALWSGKSTAAGSGYLVSDYTGMTFAEGTSVGIGQIMEFYINFGATGVFVGCLIVGALLAMLDSAAGQRLRAGDWQGFALWYLPGLSLLNVEGSLVETMSSAAAALLTAILVNRYLLRRYRRHEGPPGPLPPA